MELSREEQETIIRGNAASKTWEVVTSDPAMMRYMESRGYEPDARKNPWGYKSYMVEGRPRIPMKNKRVLTDEQRMHLATIGFKKQSTESRVEKETKSETGTPASPE